MAERVMNYNADNRYRVAYEMAKMLWGNKHGTEPSLDQKDEFLDVVRDCTNALAFGGG